MAEAQLKQLEAELRTTADNLRQSSDLKSSQYSNPVLGIIVQLAEMEAPLFKAIGANLRANPVLARTRDALLPRLISGKLRVDDLAIQFPSSLAAGAPAA
jgi:type I restriction enzyme S subunit